jgi:hypothetical protein
MTNAYYKANMQASEFVPVCIAVANHSYGVLTHNKWLAKIKVLYN